MRWRALYHLTTRPRLSFAAKVACLNRPSVNRPIAREHARIWYNALPFVPTENIVKNIVLSLSSETIAMRECMIGALEYANTQRDWNLTILPDPRGKTAHGLTPRFVQNALRTGVDGVITGLSARAPGFDALMSSGIPVVLNNAPPDWVRPADTPVTLVHNDDLAIGRMGARYLHARGAFRAYGFVREPAKNFWSTYRCRGFDLELSRQDVFPHVFNPAQATLADWLRRLPKPAAVMLSTDLMAEPVFNACRRLRISIPSQIAVLGVDNDELLCKSCRPALSSIQPDHMGMGRRAAEELHRLMKTRKPGNEVFIPSKDLVERASTRTIPPAGHLVEQALAYIREHVREGLTVARVATHLKVSPSLLRTRFRTCYGQSVQDILIETRLQAAQELLKDPTRRITEIAEKAGFASLERMAHLFRERLNTTPSKWREAHVRLEPARHHAQPD